MEDPSITASRDLFRRLPPHRVSENLALLVSFRPELADELSSVVDQPLTIAIDATNGKEYLVRQRAISRVGANEITQATDYNKDGDSFRSPWSNLYDPPFPEDDGTTPSPLIRALEIQLNEAFQTYRELYYEGGVSSVYLWDAEDGFAGVVLIKKSNSTSSTTSDWDSIHVFESSLKARTATYRITSTVMLYMVKQVNDSSTGDVSLGGSMTRQVEGPYDSTNRESINRSHTINIGKMVEDMEIALRNSLGDVYFSKTQNIVSSLKSNSVDGFKSVESARSLQAEMLAAFKKISESQPLA